MRSLQKIIQISALLLTVGTVSEPFLKMLKVDPVQAQSASSTANFPLPASLPSGTTVKVDGSSSMKTINESLKQRFAENFPGTTVDLAANGSDEAVKALLDGKTNLAAVGRPLTSQEQAQGLVLTPVGREKIAIIIGSNNSFKGNLTFEQFAKMFRGEITDWSQVGGQPGKIRFIDRPETSDTRRALSNYTVFQSAPFANGTTTTRVNQDETDAVVKELGTDGIGYAIADQVIAQPGVQVLEMHGTLPSDPRYPYSQPRGYVYKQGGSDPATLAFLGFVTTKPGQEIVQEANPKAAIVPSPAATVSPSPTAPTETALAPATVATETRGGFPWWLLGIPLLGGLLWWFLKGRGRTEPTTVAPRPVSPPAPVPTPAPAPVPAPVPVAKTYDSRIILTPRNCQNAYAYWEVGDEHKAELRRQGGRKLALRLYDVTGINLDRQDPHSIKEFECQEIDTDRHLPIEWDDRDYLVDLGYVAEDGRWLNLARSAQVHVPACTPREGDPLNVGGLAVAGGAAAVGAGLISRSQPAVQPPKKVETGSRITLTPRTGKDAYAYWEADEADREVLKRQGGKKMMLRLYDVTDINMDDQYPHSVQQFDVSEADQAKHLPILVSDRDYIVEVGYVTEAGRWLKLARSNHVLVPAFHPTPIPSSMCAIQHLQVHSRRNCYLLNADQMWQLENHTAITKTLEPGSCIIRIKQGLFGYHSETETQGEPIVVLWIHGGKFVNQKTNIPVNTTWSTLNGYDETLCLEIQETATLHAFFFDTYSEDNNTDVTLSVIQQPPT